MKFSEIASQMLEVLPSHRHWTKRQMQGGRGAERRCLYGALFEAPETAKSCRSRTEFDDHFMELAREMFPGLGMKPKAAMMAFNDHPEVSYTDVRAVLEKIRAGDL